MTLIHNLQKRSFLSNISKNYCCKSASAYKNPRCDCSGSTKYGSFLKDQGTARIISFLPRSLNQISVHSQEYMAQLRRFVLRKRQISLATRGSF